MSMLGPGAEFDLIRSFLARAGEPRLPYDVILGAGDDAAVVSAHPLAVSCDLSIEDVHFRRDWLSAEEIGWRAATAGLSDMAAMAARPVGLLLSIAAHHDDARGYVERVVAGAMEAARAVDARLIGGDLTRSPGPLILDAVALGEVAQPLRRDGARLGDEIWVTGRLGAPAAAARDWLAGGRPAPAARARFARPMARTHEALWLRQRVDLTAGLDLSDGLAGDLAHIAAASGVTLVIERAAVPIHDAASTTPELAITGGEEYELCIAVPAGSIDGAAREFEIEFGLPLTKIGAVVAPGDAGGQEPGTARVWLKNPDGALEAMPAPSYRHFMEEQ